MSPQSPRPIRLLATLALLWLSLAPSLASACPACLGQDARLSNTLKVVGVFMLVPFLIAGAVVWALRTAQSDEHHGGPSSTPPEL